MVAIPWLLAVVTGISLVNESNKLVKNLPKHFATQLTIQVGNDGGEESRQALPSLSEWDQRSCLQLGVHSSSFERVLACLQHDRAGKLSAQMEFVRRSYPWRFPLTPENAPAKTYQDSVIPERT